jgi:hypothetical protein
VALRQSYTLDSHRCEKGNRDSPPCSLISSCANVADLASIADMRSSTAAMLLQAT